MAKKRSRRGTNKPISSPSKVKGRGNAPTKRRQGANPNSENVAPRHSNRRASSTYTDSDAQKTKKAEAAAKTNKKRKAWAAHLKEAMSKTPGNGATTGNLSKFTILSTIFDAAKAAGVFEEFGQFLKDFGKAPWRKREEKTLEVVANQVLTTVNVHVGVWLWPVCSSRHSNCHPCALLPHC